MPVLHNRTGLTPSTIHTANTRPQSSDPAINTDHALTRPQSSDPAINTDHALTRPQPSDPAINTDHALTRVLYMNLDSFNT